MRRISTLAALAALAASQPAMAGNNFSYNQIDASFGWGALTDTDNSYNGKGWRLGGSLELVPHTFVFGELERASGKTWQWKLPCDLAESCEQYDPVDHATQKGYQFGLGFNWALQPGVDLVTRASWNHVQRWYGFAVSGNNPAIGREVDISGSGLGLEIGVRGLVGRVDWNAAVRFSGLDADLREHEPQRYNAGSTTVRLEGGVRVHLTPRYGIGGGVILVPAGASEARLQFHFRMQFGDWH